MAHLEALGIDIDIDTSNVLRVRGNVKYYKNIRCTCCRFNKWC